MTTPRIRPVSFLSRLVLLTAMLAVASLLTFSVVHAAPFEK